MLFTCTILLVSLNFWHVCCQLETETELVLAHVIFRHGERTTIAFYPKDPYRNYTFYPFGLGALTNKGKFMMFKLGQLMRSKYGSFLGEDYIENQIMARSTSIPRTLMSAYLVLAGLFPPSESLKWHPNLMWQPIPVFTKPIEEEDLLTNTVCPARDRLLSALTKNASIYNVYVQPYKNFLAYIKHNTGLRGTDLRDVFSLYSILKAESDFGLTLPTWTRKIYPKALYQTASLIYEYINCYSILKKLHAGYLLQKIINDTMEKINHKLLVNERKMFLYSAHESTIANFLYLLNVLKPRHIPQYGSTIFVELHKHAEDYYIMVKYLSHPLTANITILSIPRCTKLCPVKKFIELYKEFLPDISYKAMCEAK